MNKRTLLSLSLVATMAVAATANASSTVDHYSTKGYTQTTYFSAPGVSAMFVASENAIKNGKPVSQVAAFGSASVFLPGFHFILYVARDGESSGTVNPISPSMKGQGSAMVEFPVTRVEYIGFNQISRIDGMMSAGSTLADAQIVDWTRQVYQNNLNIPGLGLIFSVSEVLSGKIGFEPTGIGGMIFTPTNGVPEVIFAPGTPVNSASWMGWMKEHETTVEHN